MGEVQLGLFPINMEDVTGDENPDESKERVAV